MPSITSISSFGIKLFKKWPEEHIKVVSTRHETKNSFEITPIMIEICINKNYKFRAF